MTICPGEALGKPFDALEIALRRKKKTGGRAEIGARSESPAVVASGGSPVGVTDGCAGGWWRDSGLRCDLQWAWGASARVGTVEDPGDGGLSRPSSRLKLLWNLKNSLRQWRESRQELASI